MSAGDAQLAGVDITYRRDPDAPVVLTLSRGAVNAALYPSPLGGRDLRLDVIEALLRLIPYEGDLT